MMWSRERRNLVDARALSEVDRRTSKRKKKVDCVTEMEGVAIGFAELFVFRLIIKVGLIRKNSSIIQK